jgi:CHAD domain-containing protein
MNKALEESMMSEPDEPNQIEAPETKDLVERFLEVKTPGVQAGDVMSEAGRKILGFHFARMIANESGTRLGEDIEALHDMRVATRRMRVALELFGTFFKKKALKPYRNGLRNTGRALGRVRDLDVFSDKLKGYLESQAEGERSGFEVFLSQWEARHTKAQSKLVRYLDSERYQAFAQGFGQFLNTPGGGAKRPKALQPTLARDVAPIMTYERLAAVRVYEGLIENATVEELHSLRIQLKKLRYLVEFLADVLGPEREEVVRAIKDLQDHLGNLNDADVACQILNAFVARLESEQATLPIGQRANPQAVLTYLAKQYDQRHRLIESFPGVWQRLMGREFSEALARAVAEI